MAEVIKPLLSEPHDIFGSGPMWEGDGWGLIIRVQTDAQRDRLTTNPEILPLIAAIADEESERPTEFYGYTVQSQETVDREYEGSWFYAER